MPKPLELTTAHLTANAALLEHVARDWVERECSSFDELVKRERGETEGSIWEMPVIDSKRVVGLLTEEWEPILQCRVSPTVIRPGGYTSATDLLGDLMPKLKARCMDAPSAPTNPVARPASTDASLRELVR